MRQLTQDEAIALAASGEWKDWTDEQIVAFQFYQEKLCMDFSRFHEAMEKVMGRPVWTHEFAFRDRLQAELEGKLPAPTMEDILALIPPEKLIAVLA